MQSSKCFFLIIALVAAPAIAESSRQLLAQPQSSTVTSSATTSRAQRPLKMGVIPYLSPGTLIAEYAGLRDYLAAELKRAVIIHTALDLRQFSTRTEQRDFDIVLTAPHLLTRTMAVAYQPLMAVRADFYAHILVPVRSPARNLREVVGARMHNPPPSAFTSIESGVSSVFAPAKELRWTQATCDGSSRLSTM